MQMYTCWCVCAWKSNARTFHPKVAKPKSRLLATTERDSLGVSKHLNRYWMHNKWRSCGLLSMYIIYISRVCWHWVWPLCVAHNSEYKRKAFELSATLLTQLSSKWQIFRFFSSLLCSMCLIAISRRTVNQMDQAHRFVLSVTSHKCTSTAVSPGMNGHSFLYVRLKMK